MQGYKPSRPGSYLSDFSHSFSVLSKGETGAAGVPLHWVEFEHAVRANFYSTVWEFAGHFRHSVLKLGNVVWIVEQTREGDYGATDRGYRLFREALQDADAFMTSLVFTYAESQAQAAPTPTAVPSAGAADVGHLGSFPPKPHQHLTFTLPSGWQTYTGARGWNLSGQTLVTSLYRPITGVPAIWVTALPGGDYPSETPESMLRRSLEGYERDADVSLILSATAIMQGSQALTVAGVPGHAAEYQVRPRSGRDYWEKAIALKRGNVFWIIEYTAQSTQEFRDSHSALTKFLDSVSFNY